MRRLGRLLSLLAMTSIAGVAGAHERAAPPALATSSLSRRRESGPKAATAEVAKQADEDLAELGSLSLGQPNAGALLNGVQLQDGPHWTVMQAANAWATAETCEFLKRAIDRVQLDFPGSHKLFIGDMSRARGGPLRPHASHQSGRDVDLSYYYRSGYQAWYQPASSRALDRARSWAFVRALLTETDVEMIFIDLRVQRMLYEHALGIGESPAWLDSIFGFRNRHFEPIIRHAFGHVTHMHVRFYNPRAQQHGMLAYESLVARKVIKPRNHLIRYRARSVSAAAPDGAAVRGARAGSTAAVMPRGALTGTDVMPRGALTGTDVMPRAPIRGQAAPVAELTFPPRRLPPWDPWPYSVATKAAAGPQHFLASAADAAPLAPAR